MEPGKGARGEQGSEKKVPGGGCVCLGGGFFSPGGRSTRASRGEAHGSGGGGADQRVWRVIQGHRATASRSKRNAGIFETMAETERVSLGETSIEKGG